MNQKKYLSCFLICFLYVWLFSSCTFENRGNDKVNLHLNFPDGSNFNYYIKNTEEVSAMGSNMHQETNIEVNYKKIADSNQDQVIKATISRIMIKIKSPTLNLSFDTKKETQPHTNQPAIAKMLKLANKSFFIHVKQTGQIKMTPTKNNAQNNQSDSMLLQLLQQSFDFYPTHPVALGERWKATVSLPFQGVNTSLETTYTLTGIHEDTAIINALATLKAPKKTIVINHTKMKIEINGTQKGQMKIYIPEGRLLTASFSSKINSLMQAEGQKLESVTKGTSSITCQKNN